jgi:hypothetical protein
MGSREKYPSDADLVVIETRRYDRGLVPWSSRTTSWRERRISDLVTNLKIKSAPMRRQAKIVSATDPAWPSMPQLGSLKSPFDVVMISFASLKSLQQKSLVVPPIVIGSLGTVCEADTV